MLLDKSCRNFSPVAELQGTLAQSASGDHSNRVSGAAIDLDEGDEPLAVFLIAARIFDAKFHQAQHRQSHAEDLSGAEMSVSLFGVVKIFVEGFHGNQLSAFSLQLSINGARCLWCQLLGATFFSSGCRLWFVR